MTPLERYRQELAAGRAQPDAAQAATVQDLEALYQALLTHRTRGWWQDLGSRLGWPRRQPAPRGLYLWGGVGRGKTWLMDLFHQTLPPERKLRMHFHRFMQRVHRDLNARRGERNPLRAVADGIAAEADLLCFDEFHVSDIGDAMILAGLLERLFARGVVLVATSNLPPRRLYEHGLQRKKFLPAIELIEAHCEVVNMDGGQDYRLRHLEKAAIYHSPLGPQAEAQMRACWALLADGAAGEEGVVIEVLGRGIPARRRTEDLVWFGFEELCEGPRSAADYIELAREFHTLLLEGVPVLDGRRDNAARRFIALVDECYDRGVKLVISAAVPPHELYQGHELAFAFERTESRLLEMQSHDYLAREHRP